MKKGLVILALITSICSSLIWATDKTPQPAQWVVGSRPFTLNKSYRQSSNSLKNLSESLPSIILENLGDAGVRVLLPEEILERQLVTLYKERTNLANSLESATKDRDRQIFLSSKERTVKTNLKEKEKKIQEYLEQLKEKDEEIADIKDKLKEKNFSDVERQQETIVLWNQNSASLLKNEAVKQENINGLLTGEITVSGNYISVKVNFEIYPGKIHGIEITSATSLTEVTIMAQEIASQLKPILQNRPTVMVDFDISPVEALEKTRILVDGEVFFADHFEDTKIIMAEGSHRIEVEAAGYRTKTFTGDFSGSKEFLAKISLDELEYQPIEINSEKYSEVQVYINGIPEGNFDETLEVTTGLVFGTIYPTLLPKYSEKEVKEAMELNESTIEQETSSTQEGEFSSETKVEEGEGSKETDEDVALSEEEDLEKVILKEEEISREGIVEDGDVLEEGVAEEEMTEEHTWEVGDPYYFVAEIEQEPSLTQLNLRLKRDSEVISDRIEKRRRAMYNSYSALIISLIPTFVSYGIYVNTHNSWALGHNSEENAKMWKNISTGSMILSAGLGVNFVIQLGLFIGAADGVLPEKAKKK